MTPQAFAAAYLSTAQQVSAGTGIAAGVLLAQWANETDWGTAWAGAPNNLGNIRCGPGGAIQSCYATLADFAAAAIATWHNGYYGAVLAAVGPDAQLATICASPWSSGHYGGSLAAFYAPLAAYSYGVGTVGALDEKWLTDADLRLTAFLGIASGTTPPVTIADLLAAIKAQATAAPLDQAAINLAVMAAFAPFKVELDAVAGDVATVKRLIEKDLAP